VKKIFYFRFFGRPKESNTEAADKGGAYINCWINRESQEEAESYARGSIADEDWTIVNLEEAFEASGEDYAQDEEGMAYFKQAEVDDEVFVFHTYPIDAADGGDET
jgi:hypothetical protein